tara:strand:- start:2540 stop:2911 length:372 start_codon:yes stop_codon:yes gene_type:complete
MKNFTNKLVKITDILNSNFEGCTIDSDLNKPIKRYIVGGFSTEDSFKFCPANLRGQKIFDFVENQFTKVESEKLYFGIWYDKTNNHIYIDVCKGFNDLNLAKKASSKNKQICLFDSVNKIEIY